MKKILLTMVLLAGVSHGLTLNDTPYDTEMWDPIDPFGFATLRLTANSNWVVSAISTASGVTSNRINGVDAKIANNSNRLETAFVYIANNSNSIVTASDRIANESNRVNTANANISNNSNRLNSVDSYLLTNLTTKVYNPSTSNEWIDGAGNKYVISNFWEMTFSEGFDEQDNINFPPSQTTYLFSNPSQYYFERPGGQFSPYWRFTISAVYHFPGGFYNREWLPTTNSLVLDPVVATGAQGYVYIRPYSTTNIAMLATEAQVAIKVSTNDATYLATVSKAATALQSETDSAALAALDAHGTNTLTHTNKVSKTGDTMTGSLLTTVDHTTMAPADNELITGGFARSLLSFGKAAYMTTNRYPAAWLPTNTTGVASYDNPVQATNTFTVGAVGSYIATMVDTNAVSAGVPLQGPSTVHVHLGIASGAPVANYSLSVKPEIYYTYSLAVTNLTLGDFSAEAQTWTSGQNTGKDFAIAWPTVYPTNSYYRVYRLKIVAKGSAITSCTMGVGGTDSSYVTYQTSGEEASAVQANLNSHSATTIQSAHPAGVWSTQTWGAAGTNATYQLSWDITNKTFKVLEILP